MPVLPQLNFAPLTSSPFAPVPVGPSGNWAMTTFRLKLYIASQSAQSLHAMANLEHICEAHLPGQYDLTVIDVLEHPDVLESENITYAPVVVREFPLPVKRVVGDLTGDVERFIKAFDL